MESIEIFLQSVPLIKALLLVSLGAALWHGIKAFIDSYVKTRSKSIAEDVNLQAELRRLILCEEAKLTVQRLNTEKALGAMKILRLLAEVDTKLTDWQFSVYFRMDELSDNQPTEELGRKDLKDASALLVSITSEANAYIVLLGDDIYRSILDWVSLIHKILFEYEAVYQASMKINVELDSKDKQRITTVSNLLTNQVGAQIHEIGLKRQQIMKKLSLSVHSSVVVKTS